VLLYGLASLVGIGAFVYPFFVPRLEPAGGLAHTIDSPLLLALLGGLSLAALVLEVQGDATSDAKQVALLGVLVGLNAVLGFLETALPGPGGFSPVFFLIIVAGYVYGGRFGFLLGTLTMFVSALVTGGVGPWLPYRMLVAGWVGLTTPIVALPVRALGAEGTRLEIGLLTLFGGIWGLLFGALMNLWFWPFASGPAEQYWQVGITLSDAIRRYLAFYVATSLIWDTARVVGTSALMLFFGRATLKTLRRFARRFTFQVVRRQPASEASS
jgi:energy-coupling factor transport system substrate-specific component